MVIDAHDSMRMRIYSLYVCRQVITISRSQLPRRRLLRELVAVMVSLCGMRMPRRRPWPACDSG